MKYNMFVESIKSLKEGFYSHHEYVFERIGKVFGTNRDDLLVFPKNIFERDFESEKTLYVFEEKTFTEIIYFRDKAQFRTFPYAVEALIFENLEGSKEPWILQIETGKQTITLNSLEDSNEPWNQKFKGYLQDIYIHNKERLL